MSAVTHLSERRAPVDPPMPWLRADLDFVPGPEADDGSPTFAVYDPVTGRYHRFGWIEALILRLLAPGMTEGKIRARLAATSAVRLPPDALGAFAKQLLCLGLAVPPKAPTSEQIEADAAKRKTTILLWLLHHYLYFRIPLLEPDPMLRATVGVAKRLASAPVLLAVLAFTLSGLFTLAGRWEEYVTTFQHFFTLSGLAAYGAAISCMKAAHEFSHAYAARSLGIRVRSMGIAFMVFWPIPYCDVTDAWRLPSRRARLRIAAAGIASDLSIGGLALFAWGFCLPGVLQSVCFVLSSTALLSTLFANLNPAMRFDGYYLLADLWDEDNLQPRAFGMTRWWFRRRLLGLEAPPPEHGVPPHRLVCFIGYSLYAWVYRFLLYISIAVMVYGFINKVIGLFLFAVEVAWFLVRPVWDEAKEVYNMRAKIRMNPRLAATGAVLGALLLWAGLPLTRRLDLPAAAVPARSQVVYAPRAGELESWKVRRGDTVKAGDRLGELRSEMLLARLAESEAVLARLSSEIDAAPGDPEGLQRFAARQQMLERQRAEVEALRRTLEQMRLQAALDGVVIEAEESLAAGTHVGAQAVLARIAHPDGVRIVAYVSAAFRDDLKAGDEASFLTRNGRMRVRTRITKVEPSRAASIDPPSLTSAAGGEIAVVMKDERPVPVGSWYRVEAEPVGEGAVWGETGWLSVTSAPRSWLAEGWRRIHGTIIRESGL